MLEAREIFVMFKSDREPIERLSKDLLKSNEKKRISPIMQ